MKLCGHCQRHILDDARACPFCRHRPQWVGASVMLGVVLGLGSVGCGPKDDGETGATSMTPADDDDGMSGTLDSGPSTETMGTESVGTASTTTTGTPDTTDEGGSYYAGPGSTTWEESSSSTTSEESSDSTDAGGSYYAGPSTGIWDEDPERPA